MMTAANNMDQQNTWMNDIFNVLPSDQISYQFPLPLPEHFLWDLSGVVPEGPHMETMSNENFQLSGNVRYTSNFYYLKINLFL